MRLIRYMVLAGIATTLIFLALANRTAVTLNLLPDALNITLPFRTSVDLPLFIVIFGGIGIGLLFGFVWEWVRERKHRGAARREHKQVVRLGREIDRLKAEKHEGQDDVIALLEDAK